MLYRSKSYRRRVIFSDHHIGLWWMGSGAVIVIGVLIIGSVVLL
jgi:hypothetical protein